MSGPIAISAAAGFCSFAVDLLQHVEGRLLLAAFVQQPLRLKPSCTPGKSRLGERKSQRIQGVHPLNPGILSNIGSIRRYTFAWHSSLKRVSAFGVKAPFGAVPNSLINTGLWYLRLQLMRSIFSGSPSYQPTYSLKLSTRYTGRRDRPPSCVPVLRFGTDFHRGGNQPVPSSAAHRRRTS